MVSSALPEPYFPEPLIRQAANSIIGRYRLTVADRPDIEQFIRVRIVQAWSRYDPRIAQQNTFSDRVVWAAVASFVRNHLRQKRDPRRVDGTLQACGYEPATARRAADHEVLRLDTNAALDRLSPDDRRYAEAIKDWGPWRGATRVGLTRRGAESAIERIRSVFVSAGMLSHVHALAEGN